MWLRAFAAATSVALAAAVLVVAGRAHSASPGIGGGRILMTVFSEPCCGLTVIDDAGIHTIAIGAPDPSLEQPAWAGTDAVVFSSLRGDDGRRHIYEVASAGGPPRRLPVGRPGLSQQWPAVSADGTRIAYSESDTVTSTDRGLYVAGIDGRDQRQVAPPVLVNDESGWGEPQFVPGRDGELVVARIFARGAGRSTLWLVPGAPRNLTPPGLDAGYPRFSPDGRSILFSEWFHKAQVHGPGIGPLWEIPAVGATIARPITHHPPGSWSYEGDWSPDGRHIAYLYHRAGWDHNQLRIMDADGSDDHAVWTAPSGTFAATPDWGP